MSGPVLSHNGHCELAHATTGLAVASCVSGYYQYGSILGFKDGNTAYNMHVLFGTMATIGFIASTAHASQKDGSSHAVTGAVSGVAFVITIGVLYF